MLWLQKNIWGLCNKRQWISRQRNKLKKVREKKTQKSDKKNIYNVDRSWKTSSKGICKIIKSKFHWSSSKVKEAGNRFHYNVKVGLQAHPWGYRGVNLNSTTQVQNKFNNKPWLECELEGELHQPYNNIKHITTKVRMDREGGGVCCSMR
jgi:hypothetical protein